MNRLFLSAALCFAVAASASAATLRADYDLDDDGLIEIFTLDDLNEIRNNLDGTTLFGESVGCDTPCTGFELANDLDFDTNGSGGVESTDDYWNSGLGWDPIDGLAATFNGNGFTIANLFIDRDETYLGLFGQTAVSSEITNLKLTGVDITGGANSAGAVAGWSLSAISDCQVEGTITVYTNGDRARAGGVAGYSGAGIDRCSVDITLDGTDAENQIVMLGGIAGYAEGSAGVGDSTATGSITGSGLLSNFYAAGIVGFNGDGPVTGSVSSVSIDVSSGSLYFAVGGIVGLSINTGASVENSYSSGTIRATTSTGSAASVGGVVGYAYGDISKSFSTANVSASGGSSIGRAGGVAGGCGSGVTISNVHASGSATSNADSSSAAAGLVAESYCTVTNGYATGAVTAQGAGETFAAGDIAKEEIGHSAAALYYDSDTTGVAGGNTTAELQCPTSAGDTGCSPILFADWSDAVWDFGTSSQYPVLIINGNSVRDSDGDGVADVVDAFPDNAAASVDADADGLPDEWNAGCDATCQSTSGLTLDGDPTTPGSGAGAGAGPVTGESLLGASGTSGAGAAWAVWMVLLFGLRRKARSSGIH